jgi:hypothetical protein
MADKKLSQFTEQIVALVGADLVPIVANTVGTPENRKVQIRNFLQWQVDFPQTTTSLQKFTANVASAATAATLSVAEYILQSNVSTWVTVRDRIGLIVRNQIQNGNSNVTGQMWGALVQLDSGNSNCVSANTYGLVVDHTLNVSVATARYVSPYAFIALKDKPGTGGAATTYLMDIGAQGNTVSANIDTGGNTLVVFSNTAVIDATHTLKIRVNGMDVWLLASNTGPA